METALFLVDTISLFLTVLTLGGRSSLNAFVVEENAVPPSFLAFSPAPLSARITFARSVDRRSRISSPAGLSREGLLAVYKVNRMIVRPSMV